MFLVIVAPGCVSFDASEVHHMDKPKLVRCGKEDCKNDLTITYLGAAGFLIKYLNDSILLSPFFSNSNFLKGLFVLEANTEVINEQAKLYDSFRNVDAILVGHAHYDHLLDVPHIATDLAKDARIFGNESVFNLMNVKELSALEGRVENSLGDAWARKSNTDDCQPERPETVKVANTKHLRYLPIISEHAPHLLGLTGATGTFPPGEEKLPTSILGWKAGTNLGFYLEFVNQQGKVEYSLMYIDSSSSEPSGFPPDCFAPVDVLIPTVSLFGNVKNHPEAIVSHTKPRHTILGHWDNFFKPYSRKQGANVPSIFVDVGEFIDRLKSSLMENGGGAGFTLPARGATVIYGPMPHRHND